MADPASQTYATHRRTDVVYLVHGFLLCAVLVLGMAALVSDLPLTEVNVVILAVAGIGVWMKVRHYATRLQDRIIRLEMEVRLHRIAPEPLRARIGDFTLRQLIALRFASDAELPALAQQVLDEKIQDADAIKRLITDWRPDTLRV